MSGKRRRWGVRLLRLLGLGLLAYVLWQVDWRDSVMLTSGVQLRGVIQGDIPESWDEGETLGFLAQDEAEPKTYARADIDSFDIGGVSVPQVNEGLVRIVRRSHLALLLLGVAIFGVTSHFGVLRWWILLRAQGIRVSFWLAHKLTFLGLFFNNVVPGATGGDVVKAVYVARSTDKRAKAVMTVLVDRVTGVVALALIAAAVLVTELDNPAYREAAVLVFGFLGAFVVGCVLFFSRRLRRLLRIDAIVAKLPGGGLLAKADEAVLLYRHQKMCLFWAMLLSFGNQLAIQGIMILFAAGLNITTRTGVDVPISDYLVVLPVGFIVSAIPVLPGGWGVREGAFAFFFQQVGVSRNAAVALSVLAGMLMLSWSLLGGVYFLLGRAAGERIPTGDDVTADGTVTDSADQG